MPFARRTLAAAAFAALTVSAALADIDDAVVGSPQKLVLTFDNASVDQLPLDPQVTSGKARLGDWGARRALCLQAKKAVANGPVLLLRQLGPNFGGTLFTGVDPGIGSFVAGTTGGTVDLVATEPSNGAFYGVALTWTGSGLTASFRSHNAELTGTEQNLGSAISAEVMFQRSGDRVDILVRAEGTLPWRPVFNGTAIGEALFRLELGTRGLPAGTSWYFDQLVLQGDVNGPAERPLLGDVALAIDRECNAIAALQASVPDRAAAKAELEQAIAGGDAFLVTLASAQESLQDTTLDKTAAKLMKKAIAADRKAVKALDKGKPVEKIVAALRKAVATKQSAALALQGIAEKKNPLLHAEPSAP